MARIETWFEQDLKKPVKPRAYNGSVFTLDNVGSLIGVEVYSDGEPVTLTGTVNGYVILPDEKTTVPVSGTRSENKAYIALPQSALAYPGFIKITIKLTNSSEITTLLKVVAIVEKSRTDTVITPSSQIITDWSQQIAAEMQSVEDASAAQDVKINDSKSALNFTKGKLDRYAVVESRATVANQYGYAYYNGTIWKIGNNSSTSWIQNKYAVTAGHEYNIKASLTKQSDTIANVYFTDSFENEAPVDNIVTPQTGTIDIMYTPSKNGYIVILMSSGGNVRASDVIVGEISYEDFHSEIEEVQDALIVKINQTFTPSSGCISSDTGEVVSVSGMLNCSFSVEGIKEIQFKASIFSANYGYGFVLDDNSWIGYHTTVTETKIVSVPQNAVTFKTCWNPSSVSQQEIIVSKLVDIDNINDQIKELQDAVVIQRPEDYTEVTGYISSDNGSTITNPSGGKHCEINTEGIKTITFKEQAFSSNYGYGFVLNDNTWVGHHTTETKKITVNVPENSVKFITCWNGNLSGGQEISLGVVVNIDEDIINKIPKTLVNFPFYPSFDMSVVPNVSVFNPTFDVDEVYDLYDSLVTQYPDWVTKVDCSDADTPLGITRPAYLSGLPIYMYKFSPKRNGTSDIGSRIKFFIVTGTHPNEYMGIFTVYYMMNTLLGMWKTNETCAQLRTMIDFIIIPCLSPWGYEYRSRVNYNGVNLNRNFPTKNWTVSGSGTEDYTGPSAGSEYETKIAMYYIEQENPNLFWDAHTGGMTVYGRYGCIDIDIKSPQYVRDVCIALSRAMSNAWIAENSDFPQTPGTTLFDTNTSSLVGEEFRWVSENITEWAFLTEQSIINNYVEGVLHQDTQEINTTRIWREQLQHVYNVTIRMLYGLCQQFFLNGR